MRAGRATTDEDFACALDNWEQFSTLKKFLVANANFEESEHVAHRLLLRMPGLEHKFKVDLIPFGGIEASPNTIAWPPGMEVMMNVAGYSDALAAAVTVEVSPGINIAVASLPGITILKLFAWADRGQENPKDAIDLVSLLRGYHEAGNESRIYEEEDALAALETAGYDIELAGAWLLGKDASVMVSAQTNADLRGLLNGTKNRRLIADMARAMLGKDNALDYSQRLLEQFTHGFTA
ncbi:MAG: nucleotidyl transferase AbiEii/AbiGii toxin family protein [Pseudomonadota bacterium]